MPCNAKFWVCIVNEDDAASQELHKIYRVLQDDDAAAEDDIPSSMRAAKITFAQLVHQRIKAASR